MRTYGHAITAYPTTPSTLREDIRRTPEARGVVATTTDVCAMFDPPSGKATVLGAHQRTKPRWPGDRANGPGSVAQQEIRPPMSTPQPTAPSTPKIVREKVKPGIWKRLNRDGSYTFEITYRDSGGVQRRETVDGRQKAAEARLAQVKADKSRGVVIAGRQTLTLQDAADAFYASTEHRLVDSTRDMYRNALERHLLPSFGKRRLESISADDVVKWSRRAVTPAYARQRGLRCVLSASMSRKCLMVLGLVYSHAKRRLGYIGANPVRELERAGSGPGMRTPPPRSC